MAEVSLPVERADSSIQVWLNLAQSLQHGGFGQAGPEYLKLARLVTQVRHLQLVRSGGKPSSDDADWAKLSAIASSVLELLEPLREASRLLAELPTRVEADPTSPTATAAAPVPSEAPPRRARRAGKLSESTKDAKASPRTPRDSSRRSRSATV